MARNERSGPAPTALAPDAPCYVKYRHLADPEAMEKMKLPSHYELLYNQFETGDRTVSTLYNRGEACVFNKISLAVRQVLSRDFGAKQLEQIMAVAPESYQIQWKKGLYDAKRGSSRIKSSEHQLVIQPILENDENDDCEGNFICIGDKFSKMYFRRYQNVTEASFKKIKIFPPDAPWNCEKLS